MTIQKISLPQYDPRLINLPVISDTSKIREECEDFFRLVREGVKFELYSPAAEEHGTGKPIWPCQCFFHIFKFRIMPFTYLLEASGIEVVHGHDPYPQKTVRISRLLTEDGHKVFRCDQMSLNQLLDRLNKIYGPHFGGYQSLRI